MDVTSYEAIIPHFINTGMPNGLRGNFEFDVHTYRQNYPDLAAVFGDNLPLYYHHYINSGKTEGRTGNTVLSPTSITTTTESGTVVAGLFNPSNSKAVSPFATRPAESLDAYPQYWTWTASNGYTLKLKADPGCLIYLIFMVKSQNISQEPSPLVCPTANISVPQMLLLLDYTIRKHMVFLFHLILAIPL